MNIEVIGTVAEVVAAIATIGTLFYLALQIRTSNRLSKAEALRSPRSDLNNLNAAFGTNDQFRKALARCYYDNASRSSFELDDTVILDMYLISVTNNYEQIYREVKEGVLSKSALNDFAGRNILATNYYLESWPIIRANFGPSFVAYFESNFDTLKNGEQRDV